ncbi:MAG: hypothetical protein ACRC92_00885 [Peptostreptococcaceae bacterium]
MRWILVFLFLYLIPLVVLFRNYNNFKRSCIYSSMYVVVVSTIVITNVYISGLNKIREAMYYQNYAFDRRYSDKYASNFDKDFKPEVVQSKDNNSKVADDKSKEDNSIEENDISKETVNNEENKAVINYEEKEQDIQKNDKELVYKFKKQIYEIETIALIPMRECMPYTKNISENIKHLGSIKEDVEYATEMCQKVIETYESMETPELSNSEYTKVVENSRNDVKTAYELRKKAMESALKLIDTKNPKYIGKITEYLNLSDKHIASFKERLNDLNDKIDKQETLYN